MIDVYVCVRVVVWCVSRVWWLVGGREGERQ